MSTTENTAEGRPARAGRPALVKRLTPERRRPTPVGHARETGDRRLGYMLVAPVIILLLAITAYPLIYNIWNSFHFDNLPTAACRTTSSAGRTSGRYSTLRSGCRRSSARWCSPW
jgi:hypothetical protein